MAIALVLMASQMAGLTKNQHSDANQLLRLQDTRHTRKLLTYFGLSSRLYSFHEHNEREKESQVRGQSIKIHPAAEEFKLT